MKNNASDSLSEFLAQYSFEDLAVSFFVLNLWLPNIASPIKSQYLYVALESIFDKLSSTSKLKSYNDFKRFADSLIPLLPSFPFLEDYLPEADWGEIKYFFRGNFYRIFYGGDLSNSYDFLYSFEVIHAGFDDYYVSNLDRSALEEFEFYLNLQNSFITSIAPGTIIEEEIERGDFGVPPETFWRQCVSFLSEFSPQDFDKSKSISRFTKELDNTAGSPMPSDEEFQSRAHLGKNCFYFFLKLRDKIFPVLPRKHLAVLFDTWGEIMAEKYPAIREASGHESPKISIEFARFVRARVKGNKHFDFACAVEEDSTEPPEIVFASSFLAGERLILIHILPPYSNDGYQQVALDKLATQFVRAEKLLSKKPTQLGLLGENKIVGFRPADDGQKDLEILLLVCVPFTTSYPRDLLQPLDFPWAIIGLDQLLGLVDEIEDTEELAAFFDFKAALSETTISPLTSVLDLFGSFKDSNSVLIAGATEYTALMLDPHWGSNHRYRSLSDFWQKFPECDSFDHPRSWKLDKDRSEDKTNFFSSRTIFAYFRRISIGSAEIILHSAVNRFTFEQGELCEFMMSSFADAISLYGSLVLDLSFSASFSRLHIIIFPKSAVQMDKKLKHLEHLISDSENWRIDSTIISESDYGIRVVFDDVKLEALILGAEDRSIQISFFLDILGQLNKRHAPDELIAVGKVLEGEKSKANRFRTFEVKDRVSFPKNSNYVVPGIREYKLAANQVARFVRERGFEAGEYTIEEAKPIIDGLIQDLVGVVNNKASQYDFAKAIPLLITNIDSLVNEKEFEQARVKNSLSQEVDYERDVVSSKKHLDFVTYHSTFRYLIEKFVQLQSNKTDLFTNQTLVELLALVESLSHLYFISDHIHYGIYPATLTVSYDFLIDVKQAADVDGMMKQLAEKDAQIELGMIGEKEDRLPSIPNPSTYLDEIGSAFSADLGFSFSDLMSFLHMLAHWGYHSPSLEEKTYYNADLEEISSIAATNIEDFDPTLTAKLLEFLTLDPEKVLLVEGNPNPQRDLPVWEYRKRPYRYNLRPLIKIEDQYYWGPFSAARSTEIWGNLFRRHKLPCDFHAPNIVPVLDRGHDTLTHSLQNRIKEIVSRYTSFVATEVSPQKLGLSEDDIGDVDVFALSKNKKTLLNIESKIIDQAFCNKDLKRVAEKIFGRTSKDGRFQPGYLSRVELRASFLKDRGKELAEKFWGTIPEGLTVISLFVTSDAVWWTMFPLTETSVNFVEIRLLDDFLKSSIR